jgi:hypothetical protein
MKHQTLEHLQTIAEVHADRPPHCMSRSERLGRWAELLEQRPDRDLGTLSETEYQTASIRETMRSSVSPITVAFDDPYVDGPLPARTLLDDLIGSLAFICPACWCART